MRSFIRNWHDIWSTKGLYQNDRWLDMDDLLALSGYDSGADGINAKIWRAWVSRLLCEIGVDKTVSTWLDVGCGSGSFLFSLPAEIYKHGFDYSESLIRVAERYAVQRQIPCKLYSQDMTKSDLEIPKVDVASCISSLQYITHQDALNLIESLFNTVTQGVVIAETPDRNHLERAMTYRINTLKYTPDEKLTHTYYDPKFFDDLATQYSFRPMEIKVKLGNQSKFRWCRFYSKV